MTNKTREKLQKEFDKKYYGLSENDVWKWIEKSITQSENRILRKWKKAMEKAMFKGDFGQFIDDTVMKSEYLKAKGCGGRKQ